MTEETFSEFFQIYVTKPTNVNILRSAANVLGSASPAAWERIAAGASLVQLYTGWIYRGPELVPCILDGLLQQLEHHGLPNIAAAVGCGLPWQER